MELIATGRDADVFAIDHHRVLRRYRHYPVPEREVRVMRHLTDTGFPVPRVHDVAGNDLVLQRLHGPTLATSDVTEPGRLLAEVHNRLHSLAAPTWLGEGAAILHLDLHPLNVIVTDDGPHVIDWTNVDSGDPASDVADTVAILRAVDVDTIGIPGFAQQRDQLLEQFLAHIDHDPAPRMPEAATRRLDNPNLTESELRRLRDLIKSG
ncbi:phosphotransferase family enzyme [Stackebrandtia endophytica]|uniref:Phosphotransferase family enzyme n=1 Tax=Stackebrandtia endophytica TaxID=1496996 RepID=A0A543ASC4_9ACTN|nr:phosphotransferase [Stackebrandtia endophytica]TQL75456.1 phosphotransferase family enzyme [Stackebrandtia endophytica]